MKKIIALVAALFLTSPAFAQSGGAIGGSSSGPVVITSVTTSGSAGNVTFSSIPQTYRNLEIQIVNGKSNVAAAFIDCDMQFNGDTGSNYETQQTNMTGSVNAFPGTAQAQIPLGALGGTTAPSGANLFSKATIGGYTVASHKDVIWDSVFVTNTTYGTSNNVRASGMGIWKNTAAITSIKVFPASSNTFVDGTIIRLIGYP